ncbi:MAG TPA: methyltransferase domain-containing protein [Candidatus Bathyarchaeia archaeon]
MWKFSKSCGGGVEYLDKEEVNCKPLTMWDLEKIPLPYGTNTFDKIVASQVLEHIVNFIPLMKELHRILKKDGKLEVWVPYVRDFDQAFGDPTHVRYFDIKTFKYFDPIHRQSNIVYKPYFDVTVERIRYYQSPTFRSKLHKLSWIVRHPAKSLRTVWLHATMRPIKEC